MSILLAALIGLAGCTPGGPESAAPADSVGVVEVVSGDTIVDLDLAEQLYRKLIYEMNPNSLRVCFMSLGTDSLGAFVDPTPEFLQRFADTGVEARVWSQHERQAGSAAIRDRETGEEGAACSIEVLRQSSPRSYAFAVSAFLGPRDQRSFTLLANLRKGKWEVTLYAPMFD